MTAEPFPTNQAPWALTAGLALGHAIDNDLDQARTVLAFMATAFGTDIFPQVLLAWADVMIEEVCPEQRGKPVRLQFDHALLGITDADGVSSSVAWAGRFIAARLANDEPMGRDLVESVGSNKEWAECVSAVLLSCGELIRKHRVRVGG